MAIIDATDLNANIITGIDYFQTIQKKYGGVAEVSFFHVKDEEKEKELDGKRIMRYLDLGLNDHLYTSVEEHVDGYVDLDPLLGPNYLVLEKSSFVYDADGVEVYLLQNNQSGDLLYTSDVNEVKIVLETLDFQFIEEAFKVTPGEVHRFYNQNADRHFITGDLNEVDVLLADSEFTYEGTL